MKKLALLGALLGTALRFAASARRACCSRAGPRDLFWGAFAAFSPYLANGGRAGGGGGGAGPRRPPQLGASGYGAADRGGARSVVDFGQCGRARSLTPRAKR